MVADASELAALRSDWDGERKMRERMQLLVTATFAGGAFTAPALASVLYNLPLLLAFDVLKQVLLQLRKEGKFSSSQRDLGPLIEAAQTPLPWLDWDAIRQGARRRNEVAHDGTLFTSTECLTDIAAIETQLLEWKVISAA